MKTFLSILTYFLASWNIYCFSFAQTLSKKDTVYYLLDTAKTPARDRLFTFEADYSSQQRFYTLNCPCLENHHKPEFRYNASQTTYLGAKIVGQLQFINLQALIDLVTKNDFPDFYNRFVIYFIIPEKRKYAKHKVFFLSGHSTTVE